MSFTQINGAGTIISSGTKAASDQRFSEIIVSDPIYQGSSLAMKHFSYPASIHTALLLLLFSFATQSLAAQRALSAKQLFETVSGSVVLISGKEQSKNVQGSGVVLMSGFSKKRSANFTYVLTNAHVAADFSELTVSTSSKAKYVGEVVAYDKAIDLALIRLDGVALKAVKSRNQSGRHLSVGDKVFAVGSPIGMANSLSEGIVSGLRERKGASLIQTTAPISKGSSGGGLFDTQGNLVGITTFKLAEGENLNFAVDLRHADSLFDSGKKIDGTSSSSETTSGSPAPNSGNFEDQAKKALRGLHPDWRDVVNTKEFRAWIETLPKTEQDRLNESWDPYFIAEKLTAFKNRRPEPPFDPSRIDCNRYVKKTIREQLHCDIRQYQDQIIKAQKSSSPSEQRFLNFDKWSLGRREKLLEALEQGKISPEDAINYYKQDRDGEIRVLDKR